MQEPALDASAISTTAAGDGLLGDDLQAEPMTCDEASEQPVKRYPTNAELHAIRQVRPITAEDLGPGPFPGGFTLEEELEFQNYVPEPYVITEERRRELAEEARKYADELIAEFGEPSPEAWRAAEQFWAAVANREMPDNPLWLDWTLSLRVGRATPELLRAAPQDRRVDTLYTVCMTAVPTRFSPRQVEKIDRLVAEGVGANRSEVIRTAVDHLADTVERSRVGRAIAESYRAIPQTPDDDAAAMANAIAMVEAEPW